MIFTNLLLNISCHSIYLMLAHHLSGDYPVIIASVLILAVFPPLLSFHLNRRMLWKNPTVLKVILINLALSLAYVGVYLLCVPTEPLYHQVYKLSLFWIFASWSSGAYYGLKSAELLTRDGYNIAVMEVSLLIMVPGIFILTVQSFPVLQLLSLIICWFVTLGLALSVEGRGRTDRSAFRYDLIGFHIFVSVFTAIILFLLAFYGQVRQLLAAAQKGFIAFVYFIFGLLNSLFSEHERMEPPPPVAPSFVPEGEMVELTQGLPLWFYAPFILLGLFLSLVLLWELIKFLQVRLGSGEAPPARHRSFLSVFWGSLRWLLLLIKNIFMWCLRQFHRVGLILGKLMKRLEVVVKGLLPPKTPGEKVLRNYERFLRWGRRIGCPRKPHETPLEYTRRLADEGLAFIPPDSLPEVSRKLGRFTAIFLQVRYGRESADWEQAQESGDLLDNIVSGV